MPRRCIDPGKADHLVGDIVGYAPKILLVQILQAVALGDFHAA